MKNYTNMMVLENSCRVIGDLVDIAMVTIITLKMGEKKRITG